MGATMTSWQKKMEDKVDRLVEAVTGEHGTNVRLAVIEAQNDTFNKQMGEVVAGVKTAVDCTQTNSKDISGLKASVGIHWALLLIVISGLIGIAFRVFG